MPVSYISSPYCLLHDVGDEHPECPDRLHSINDRLMASGLELSLLFDDAPPASIEALQRAHTKEMIDRVFNNKHGEARGKIQDKNCDNVSVHKHYPLDDDTFVMNKTLDAALYAAGAGIHAVDTVINQTSHAAFCAIRPPGHHATRQRSGGFCVFNNVAVAAYHALEHYGLERIAIVDFDVHHGNGTEDIFKHDERVMLCSSFQHPFYPFSGEQPRRDNILNIPLVRGMKGDEYQTIVTPWFSALDEFAPQMIFISAGFDAHIEDELAHVSLTEHDFGQITSRIKQIADKHCKGRIVSILEGGYALSALGRSVESHIKAMQ